MPKESLIYSVYSKIDNLPENYEETGIENLNIWKHSNGKSIGDSDYKINVRIYNHSVIAILSKI